MNGSVMNGTVMNVVCFEWSVMNGLFWTDLFWTDTVESIVLIAILTSIDCARLVAVVVLMVTLDEQLKTQGCVFCIVFSSAIWEQQCKRERTLLLRHIRIMNKSC